MSRFAYLKKMVPLEVTPIFAITGFAIGGSAFYLARLSQGSEVVWDRSGDWKPWDKIKQDQNTKFLSVNKEFWEKRKGVENKRMVDSI